MPKWIRKWKVPSNTDPETEYVVSLGDDGTWGCSCRAWIYRRQRCDHIQQMQWALLPDGTWARSEYADMYREVRA